VATIVILEHALQRYVDHPYMVYGLAERWRASGHVVVRHYGTGESPPGDLAFVNIDLTVIPHSYRPVLARYPRIVNGGSIDVSKRRFSQHLLDRYSDWLGPVILKTEANFGGKPEGVLRALAEERGVDCDIPDGPILDGYPVYRSLREVPAEAWATPGLVVERFLPEREGTACFLRTWFFLGDRERSSRWRANVEIIKASDYVSREDAEVPDEIRAWRTRLRLDFGKFDYVRHGDRFVLLDVNRSPAFPNFGRGTGPAVLDHLAAGLAALLT
jgi:hypothetical protein